VQLRLSPDPGPALRLALGSVLEHEGLLDAPGRVITSAWRQQALLESVVREPAPWGPAAPIPGGLYVAAPSPRSRRGATRA
jgi:hypothetical protein